MVHVTVCMECWWLGVLPWTGPNKKSLEQLLQKERQIQYSLVKHVGLSCLFEALVVATLDVPTPLLFPSCVCRWRS
jgi:hypothetical protein